MVVDGRVGVAVHHHYCNRVRIPNSVLNMDLIWDSSINLSVKAIVPCGMYESYRGTGRGPNSSGRQ